MDLKQILTAIAVSKYGSFSDAAAAVSFSQSAVSKQINSLEDELGIQLFDRGFQRQPVTLTKEGSEIIEHLDKIIEEYEAINKYIQDSSDKPEAVVVLGSIPTFGSFGDDRLAANYIINNPDKNLSQVSESAHKLADLLIEGSIDCMITGSSETSLWPFKNLTDFCQINKISRIPISSCPMTIGVGLNHRLAKRKSIKLEDLAGEKILLRGKSGSGSFSPNRTNDLIEVCNNAGVNAEFCVIDDASNRIRPRLAAMGYGVMINITPAVIPYNDLIMIPVDDYPYEATAYFLYKKNNRNPALRAMIDEAMRMSFANGFSDKEFRIL